MCGADRTRGAADGHHDRCHRAGVLLHAHHYYRGSQLDDRSLLSVGFGAFTEEINRAGREVSNATMPAMTGDRHADWAAFAAVYRRTMDRLADNAPFRERLAVVTLEAMVASLRDDHAEWTHGNPQQCDVGPTPNVATSQAINSPKRILPPLSVTAIRGGARPTVRLHR